LIKKMEVQTSGPIEEHEEIDYYSVLDVPLNASNEDINEAYKARFKLFAPERHTDELKGNSERVFGLLKKAHETLIDPQRRAIYDAVGSNGLELLSDQLILKSDKPEDVQEVSTTALKFVLREETNIELRRYLSKFLCNVLTRYAELASLIAKPLIAGFHETDQPMVIDAVSYTLLNSNYLQRMTDAEKLSIHERLKGMRRPELGFLKLAANVYLSAPEKIPSLLSEQFVSEKIPALVAFQILQFNNPNVRRDLLLKFIAAHTTETIDNLMECIEEYEESFPEDTDRIRREVIKSIPNPRHCSAESLGKFFNYLRLNEGVSSKHFVQSFVAAKSRIQRDPDLLDVFLVDSDDLSELLQEQSIQKIFHELTVEVLMADQSFNWIHTDSAIAILDKICDYLHYDEDQIHERIYKLMEKNDDELGYVFLTATKFLFQHAPEFVLNKADDLFVVNSNTDLRSAILNRLILCSVTELPPKSSLDRILDDVIQLESSEKLHLKALNLAEKLLTISSDYQSRVKELKQLVDTQDTRRQKTHGYDIDELIKLVQTIKVDNEDCCKDCY